MAVIPCVRAVPAALFLHVVCLAALAAGQQPFPQADAERLGFEIPDGPKRAGGGRRVTLTEKSGNKVVAEVHVEVGEHMILRLPSGRLRTVETKDVEPTGEAFVPMTQEQMVAEFKAGDFKDFKTYTTRNFVYVYNGSEVFARRTRAILESMYTGLTAYLKRAGLKVRSPETPLVIVIFGTEEQFQKYREMPPGVAAYYDGVTNHVYLYEQSRLVEIAPELALKQAISTIAHEGVHQILHNVGVQQRLSRWPYWISEGLPEYFAPTEVKRGIWKGVGKTNDLRMLEIRETYKERGVRTTGGQLLKETVEARELSSAGYAVSWGMVNYLAQRREKEFFAYLREMSGIGPLEGRGDERFLTRQPENWEQFEKHFGTDVKGVEEAMVAYLEKLPYTDPIYNQTHYVIRIQEARGAFVGEMADITTSPAQVKAWREEVLAKYPAEQRGRVAFEIRAFPNLGAAEAYLNSF